MAASQKSNKKRKRDDCAMVGPKKKQRANQKKARKATATSELLPEPQPELQAEPEPQPQSQPSTGVTLAQLPYDIVYMVSQKLLVL